MKPKKIASPPVRGTAPQCRLRAFGTSTKPVRMAGRCKQQTTSAEAKKATPDVAETSIAIPPTNPTSPLVAARLWLEAVT
ncbi:MAG: hypothetical protein M0Q42_04980 [Xanthomonadales bacterium]|nr:hypothetical protein [Xanthomonadales bacterium]